MSGFLLIQIFHYIKNNSHFRLHKLTVATIIPCIIMSSTLVNVGFTKSAAFSCLTSISFPIPNTDCNTSFPYIETVLLKNSELINTLSAIPIFPIDRKTWREESYCYIRCIPKI